MITKIYLSCLVQQIFQHIELKLIKQDGSLWGWFHCDKKKPILFRRHGSVSSRTIEETDLKQNKKQQTNWNILHIKETSKCSMIIN